MTLEESCFTWSVATASVPGETRAALVKKNKWVPGRTITISFMEGDETLHEKIKSVAKQWVGPTMANLAFSWVKKPDPAHPTDIRISFSYSGSWSVLGTSCLGIERDKPTMNFGTLTKHSTAEQVRRAVLHEFGHALGLIHEHQNPAGGIPWKKDQVYHDLAGPPHDWSKDTIDLNMFKPYEEDETNFTAVDTKSIMIYPIPEKWLAAGQPVGLNLELSATDKSFIKKQYPW